MEGDIFLLVEDALALVGAPDKLVPRRNGVGLSCSACRTARSPTASPPPAAPAGRETPPWPSLRSAPPQCSAPPPAPACRSARESPCRPPPSSECGRQARWQRSCASRDSPNVKSGALARKIVHHVVVAGQQRVLGHLGLGELDQVQQVTLPHHAHIRRTGVVCRFCHNTDKILVLRGSLNVKHLPRLQIHSPANQNICILIHVFIAWHGRFTLLCALVQSVFNSS